MPKMKTNSGAKKRFKITKGGKVKRMNAFTSHLLERKSTKIALFLLNLSVTIFNNGTIVIYYIKK